VSLAKCRACGREVSKNADRYPQCGDPLKRKTIGCGGAVGVFFLVGVFATIIIGQQQTGTDTAAPAPAPISAAGPSPAFPAAAPVAATPEITADCTIQADRKAFIESLISDGYWEKVERPATRLRVSVLPKFMNAATYDDKKSFFSEASAYDFCDGGSGAITIIDAMTGEDIGVFDQYGLRMD